MSTHDNANLSLSGDEAVAYVLTVYILEKEERNKEKILETFKECLKAVKSGRSRPPAPGQGASRPSGYGN
jgi:hypothetical protein